MSPPQKLLTSQLGKDGPTVPKLGLGLMGLSAGVTGSMPDEDRFKVLDRAWELGEVFWDTAHAYGDSEELVGKWFRLHPERRDDIFLATRFGLEFLGMSECVRRPCNDWGVDCIDLYYCHRFDEVTPVEKTMEAMVQLKKEGKIKYIGLSECSSATLRRAHATLDIENEIGTNLLATCRELGVAVVSYSPLGKGFLTGAFASRADLAPTDYRRTLPRYSEFNFPRNIDLVKRFEAVAKAKGCAPAQLVLAWIMAQGPDFFPIPGTRSADKLEQNLDALGVVVTDEENRQIRDFLATMDIGGARNVTFSTARPGQLQNTAPLSS
ncbi:Aldo/keto reductase-like protein [Hypoxylon sp. FL1284]|nr:Aldo/keto reductase-like protein [Hypoxylon sp. FL1284]